MVTEHPVIPAAALPSCAVCRGSNWTRHLNGTRLRVCRDCGTFLNDRSLNRAEEESRYTDGAAAAMCGATQVAEAQYQTLLKIVGANAPAQRSVLDLGCGRGDFLSVARERGWRTAGLELDPVSAAACRHRGLEVRLGSLFDTPVPPGPWSVITFWDVLDHLEDPGAALKLARAELAPGGVILVRGRNGALHARLKRAYSGLSPAFQRVGVPDLSVVHRWGIPAAGWARLLRNAGFDCVRLCPGVPTPGDRYASMGPRLFSRVAKTLAARSLRALHALSLGRSYPFPSVVVSGNR